MTDKNISKTEDLKTSEDWNKVIKITVKDPDGWDRANFQYSWFKEKITKTEFRNRLNNSTIEWNH